MYCMSQISPCRSGERLFFSGMISIVRTLKEDHPVQVEKCAIFREISQPHLRNFSIVCNILSSAHIKCFIYLSLFVPAVIK